MPHSAILVDNVTLSLDKTPPGAYLLSLVITDRVTGKVAGRSQQLIIVPKPPAR